MLVVKFPGKPPEVVAANEKTDPNRFALSNLVGGTLSTCFKYNNLIGWCDDDGISKGLQINFARPTDGWPIRGTVVITTMCETLDGPDWDYLSDEQASDAMDLLSALCVEQPQ